MHTNKKITEFNMLIVGTGGQGQITLLQILAEAALNEDYDVRTSELHGLSQRGGSVEVHIRLGKQIFSPMISANKADLILGLEMQESLGAVGFAGPETKFLVNQYFVPVFSEENPLEKEVLNQLKKMSKYVFLAPASEICQKELGSKVVAGVYLIGLSAFKKLIPLKPDSILKAIKKIIPEKYLELNLKAFELASESEAVK